MSWLDEKIRILEPVLGAAKANQLRFMYLMEDDYKEKKILENQLDLLIAKFVHKSSAKEIILPPPARNLQQGTINIGSAVYAGKNVSPVNLSISQINRHVGLFGATGSGKTNIALRIIRKLHRQGIPVLVIDWEQSYRNLLKDIPDLEIYTVGRDDINPLYINMLAVPPGVSYEEYAKSLTNLLGEDFLSGAGSDTMFLEYFSKTFQRYKNPTFHNFKELFTKEIESLTRRNGRIGGRRGLWLETVMRITNFLGSGAIGTVLGTNKHYPMEKLFSRPVVLEFGAIKSPRDRKFLIHLITNFLNFNLEHQGITADGQLKQVIVYEEFHNIALQSKEDNMISNLFRQGRKWGVGLIAIDQTPAMVPLDIYANMNVKISFALGTGQDIVAMANAMNLQFDKNHYLSMLATGQALINVKQFFHEPFMIQVPFTDPGPNCTDLQLKERSLLFSQDCHLICTPEEISPPSQASHKNETYSPSGRHNKLTSMEKIILTDLAAHPFDGVDKRTKRLGLHPSQIKQLHDSLIQKKIMNPLIIDSLKLFEFTKHGLNILKKKKIHYSLMQGRGGLEHSYVIMKITDQFEKLGFKTEKEKDNHDIIASCKEAIIAIEVESGKSDIARNVLKLKNSSVSGRFMIATNKQAEFKIRKFTQSNPSIQVLNFKQFLKLSKKEILLASPKP